MKRGFWIVLGLLSVGAVGGLASVYMVAGEAAREERRVRALESRMRALDGLTPAPTVENLEWLRADREHLRGRLAHYRAEFSTDEVLTARRDAVVVLPGIQRLIVDLRRRYQQNGIQIADNEAFGFRRYGQEVEPPAPEIIPALDKQVQAMERLLTILADSGPAALIRVEREAVEGGGSAGSRAERRQERQTDYFEMAPEASARIPGLVDALAFRITFTGYTDSLRQFLNRLSELEMPVLVRGVEVNQARQSAPTTVAPRESSDAASAFASLFGSGDVDRVAPAASDRPEQKPIIEDNLSQFRVTLELVELLPVGLSRLDPEGGLE